MTAPRRMFELYVVRHGATEWSVSGQHTGRSDIPLTPEGVRQAQCVATHFADKHDGAPFSSRFLRIYSSPLVRAHETARISVGSAPITVDEDLQEWDYGAYDGRRTREIQSTEATKDWNLFRDGCPGGENAEDVGKRVDRFIEKVKTVVAEEGSDEVKNICIFTHGHFARVLAARWIGESCHPLSMYA
ncbi:phosphoglycerate mutase 2 [Thoreauomyces humboldtii]|nr:phosphoglycerate mutase 2 [Thoreauomyces humboldtii]